MKTAKPLICLIAFLILELVLAAEKGSMMVCTLTGQGKDPVFEIPCRVGSTTTFEAPGVIIRYVIGDPANWLVATDANSLWIQPKAKRKKTSLVITIKNPYRVFCFKLTDQSEEDTSEQVEKVVIVSDIAK